MSVIQSRVYLALLANKRRRRGTLPPDVRDPIACLSRASRKQAPEARHPLAQPVRAGLKGKRMASTVGAAPSLVRLKELPPPSAVDLPHAPSDCAGVLHRRPYLRARVNRLSRNARLLYRQAWFRMSGDVAGSAGQCHRGHRGARPAGDSFPLRRAAHRQSGQIRGRIARRSPPLFVFSPLATRHCFTAFHFLATRHSPLFLW